MSLVKLFVVAVGAIAGAKIKQAERQAIWDDGWNYGVVAGVCMTIIISVLGIFTGLMIWKML